MNDWTDFKKHLDKLIIKDLKTNKVYLKKHVAKIYGDNQQLPKGLTHFYNSLLGTLNGTGTLTDVLGNNMEVHKLPVFKNSWEKMFKVKKNTYMTVGDKLDTYSFPNNVYDCLKNIFDDYIAKKAQTYAELIYSPEQRNLLTHLDLKSMGLKGWLNLDEFPNLKKIIISDNKINELKVDNCPNLTLIDAYINDLKKIDLTSNKKIISLDLYNNPNLTELKVDYSQLRYLDTWKTGLVRQYGNNESEATQWFWKNIFRDVERNYPTKLARGIMKLVDIKEIDKLVEEFDWDEFQNNEEYRSHFCEKDANLRTKNGMTEFYHINYALKYLSQQVLAKCLIKQNELAGTAEANWKQDTENISKKWGDNSIIDLVNPWEIGLEILQPAVNKELEKQQNPENQVPNKDGIPWGKYTLYGVSGIVVIGLLAWMVKGAKKMGV